MSTIADIPCLTCPAAALDLRGPDGSVELRVSADSRGELHDSVMQDGKPRLEPARIGIFVDGVDLGAGRLGPGVRVSAETAKPLVASREYEEIGIPSLEAVGRAVRESKRARRLRAEEP